MESARSCDSRQSWRCGRRRSPTPATPRNRPAERGSAESRRRDAACCSAWNRLHRCESPFVNARPEAGPPEAPTGLLLVPPSLLRSQDGRDARDLFILQRTLQPAERSPAAGDPGWRPVRISVLAPREWCAPSLPDRSTERTARSSIASAASMLYDRRLLRCCGWQRESSDARLPAGFELRDRVMAGDARRRRGRRPLISLSIDISGFRSLLRGDRRLRPARRRCRRGTVAIPSRCAVRRASAPLLAAGEVESGAGRCESTPNLDRTPTARPRLRPCSGLSWSTANIARTLSLPLPKVARGNVVLLAAAFVNLQHAAHQRAAKARLEISDEYDESRRRPCLRPTAADRGRAGPRRHAGAGAASRWWPRASATPISTPPTATGRSSRRLPFIPGHEGVGYVAARGLRRARHVKEGDRVGVPWLHTACGHCEHCITGWETLCDEQQMTGYTVNGGYAEYVLADPGYVGHLPANVTLRRDRADAVRRRHGLQGPQGPGLQARRLGGDLGHRRARATWRCSTPRPWAST